MTLAELLADSSDRVLPAQQALEDAAHQVVELACAKGVWLGCAESCTGGLVAGALTSVPGSSACVKGGVVSYAFSVKEALLGVSEQLLASEGAVNEACACQMATGARVALAADIAVSVTGIAGPGGAEPGKPVGTVWFGLATPEATCACRHLFSGERADVRAKAVEVALELICAALEEI